MRLTIRGKFVKRNDGWEALVPLLGLTNGSQKLTECLQGICHRLHRDINHPDFHCRYSVTNDQIFFLEVANIPAFIEYLTFKMSEWENPAEWEAEMRMSVGYRDDFEDE